MLMAFLFVLGLVVGSFLNAVIYRLNAGDSPLRGRSYCPSCRHGLAVIDLLPLISFAMLRGRCRYCHKPISWQYPAVEFVTAVAFMLLGYRFLNVLSPEHVLQVLLYTTYASFLIIIFMYDLLHYLILDAVVVPAVIVVLIGNVVLGESIPGMLLAACVAAGFFALQFFVSGGRWIGGGDIRLGFLMGVILGWPNILVALFLSYIIGSIVGVGLMLAGSKTMQSKIPFGTFLSVSTFAVMLYGTSMLDWYLNLLHI